jgi:Caudovirus prohead protease.
VVTDTRQHQCRVRSQEDVKDEREDGTVYRATSWRPMEVSIVSVPADPDVGIGRSNQVKSELMLHQRRTKCL